MKLSQVETMLTEVREERAGLTHQIGQLDAVIRWLESRMPMDAEVVPALPPAETTASRKATEQTSVKAERKVAKPARQGAKPARSGPRAKSSPLPADDIMRTIIAAIGRANRLLYIDQLAEELAKDGVDYGADLSAHLRRMARQDVLLKVRYNGVNIQMAYGMRDWRTNLDAHHAQGKNTDPMTAEIFNG